MEIRHLALSFQRPFSLDRRIVVIVLMMISRLFFFFSRVSSLVYGTRKQRSNLQIYDSHSCYVSLVDSWRRGGTLSTVCSRISFRDPARDGPVNISFVEIALFDRLWIIRGSRWDWSGLIFTTIRVACNHPRVPETLVNPTCSVDREWPWIKLCYRFNSLQGKIVRNTRRPNSEKLSESGFRSDFDSIYENFYIHICIYRTESFDFTSILR